MTKKMHVENTKLKEDLNYLLVEFDILYKTRNVLCSKCNKSFMKVTILKKHKNNHESTNSVFKCDHCDRQFN